MPSVLCKSGKTRCLSFDIEEVTAADVVQRLQEITGTPIGLFRLFHGRKQLLGNVVVPTAPTLLIARTQGLKGGKGGFGAMLRASGKGGAKKTTNFGSCRDLSGRRLRHVNNELALQAFHKEEEERELAKKNKTTFSSTADDTKSGINGWFLDVPSWAEGFGKKKNMRALAYKTRMCLSWVEARAHRKAPEGAPAHWGCSRGRHCQFAHGPKELKGIGEIAHKEEEVQKRRLEKQRKLGEYSSGATSSDLPEAMGAAVARGMRAAKRQCQDTTDEVEERKTRCMPVEGTADEASGASSYTFGMTGVPDAAPVAEALTAAVHIDAGGRISGRGNFVSLRLGTRGAMLRRGVWFYEVTLQTEGLMQIGWADGRFTPESKSGDGVGDDDHSWSYDGFRQRRWNGEAEGVEYGQSYGAWRAGDIVGCQLSIGSDGLAKIEFSLNGEPMGPAFQHVDVSEGFFPALSMNGEEAVRVNVGHVPFTYPPKMNSGRARGVVHATAADAVKLATIERPARKKAVKQAEAKETAAEPAASASASASPEEPGAADVPTAAAPSVPEAAPAVDLEALASLEAARSLGADALKRELLRRGLKCGGTLDDRAARLWAVRGMSASELATHLQQQKKRKKKRKRKRPAKAAASGGGT